MKTECSRCRFQVSYSSVLFKPSIKALIRPSSAYGIDEAHLRVLPHPHEDGVLPVPISSVLFKPSIKALIRPSSAYGIDEAHLRVLPHLHEDGVLPVPISSVLFKCPVQTVH
jgi:hypothetical protein